MEIKIGTSGYSFDDWKGTFYPKDIEKGKMLDFYVQHFPVVEINSTYYRIPHPAVMANIEKKTPNGFEFIIKVPQAVTHQRKEIEAAVDDAEFRHNGWVNRDMYNYLRENSIGYAAVDEPQLPGLLKPDMFSTTNTAYLRLHGRNGEKWWNGGPLRYDYNYSHEELRQWKEKIIKMEDKAKKMYIFFNNCHLGQAIKNAHDMMNLLDI